ncbi:hypothetical protein [Lactococcus petauri]|uniref:hypothetical protein n=1 Tax=Lactococcus petauri TaxID=1940789 RepID=UPI003851AC76
MNKVDTNSLNNNSKRYQEVYSDVQDTGVSRKIKVAGGFAAGLGLSVMGGGLAADASANTVTPSLEKKLMKDILATQESTAIELTDSTSTTEEGSSSDRPSESQSDSESATETQSEAESRADVGTMLTTGWSGNTWTAQINPGDLGINTADYSKARGTISLTLNPDGTITASANITNITKSSYGYLSFTLGGVGVAAQRITFTADSAKDGTVNTTQVLNNVQVQYLYQVAQNGSTIFNVLDSVGGGGGAQVGKNLNNAAGLAPILAFSTSLSTSASTSLSDSISQSVSDSSSFSESRSLSGSQSRSLSDSVSNSVSLSNSGSLSGSVSLSQSVSDSRLVSLSESMSESVSYLESRAASISASLSGSTSASAFLSRLASQSQSASHLESFLESIIVSESLSTSTSESNSLY